MKKWRVVYKIAGNPFRLPLMVEAATEEEARGIAAAELIDPHGRVIEIVIVTEET